MTNIVRLVGIIIVVGLVGYALIWTISNSGQIFNPATRQTTPSEVAKENLQNPVNSTIPTPSTNLPKLVEIEPRDNFTTTDQNVVVKGKTDPGNNVKINNQNVLVDSSGNFSQNVALAPGTNRVTIVAINSEGKESVSGLIYTRNAINTTNQPSPTPQSPATSDNTMQIPSNGTSAIRTGGSDTLQILLMALLIPACIYFYPKKSRL